MDKNTQDEIMRYLNTIRFGEVGIILNESLDHVDVTVTRRKRFPKKKKYDRSNVKHEG